jgi:hypothetical protein
MPRWASRITLEVVAVRCERVQEISEADAHSEGFCSEWSDPTKPRYRQLISARSMFAGYWSFIHAKRGLGWGSDPWVWVIEFKFA